MSNWRDEGVPYNPKSDEYESYGTYRSERVSVPDRFSATLQVDGYSRGRSAATIHLKDVHSGTRYTMFLSDLVALVENYFPDAGEEAGRYTLWWEFTKKGSNFGIRAC